VLVHRAALLKLVGSLTVAVAATVLTPAGAALGQERPPCIPSPSIPPGVGNQCGAPTAPGETKTPNYAPPTSSYSVKLPVAAPLANFGKAGNAIAKFSVPVRPAAGVVRVGMFIADRSFPAPGVMGYGNDRTFDGNFDANRSKLTLELNYRTGEGTAWATPSCAYLTQANGLRTSPDLCHSALPLDGSGTGSTLKTRAFSAAGKDHLDIKYSAKLSFVEGVPGVRLAPPAIDGELNFTIDSTGILCTKGQIDAYPSVEIYRYQTGQPLVTIYKTRQSSAGPLIALNPLYPNKNFNKCTGVLV
jgi:hypothetical protein